MSSALSPKYHGREPTIACRDHGLLVMCGRRTLMSRTETRGLGRAP